MAAKAATREIPIVFGIGADPVEVGLVASLNRPGGNVTGVTSLNIEVAPKRLELMHELLPSVTSMGLLVNPAVPALAEPVSRSSQAAAQALGLQLHTVQASSDQRYLVVASSWKSARRRRCSQSGDEREDAGTKAFRTKG